MMIVSGITLFVAIVFLIGWIHAMDKLDEEKFQHDNTKHRLDEKQKVVKNLNERLEAAVVDRGLAQERAIYAEHKLKDAEQQIVYLATVNDVLNKHLDDFPRRGADGKFIKNPEADGKAYKSGEWVPKPRKDLEAEK